MSSLTLEPPKSIKSGTMTFFGTTYQPTAAEVDHAEQFRDYAVLEKYSDKERTADPIGPNGEKYRWAGTINIIPWLKEFRISVRPGVREADLDFLHAEVERVRAGYLNASPWEVVESPENGIWYRISLSYGWDGPEHKLGGVIAPCREAACVEATHEEVDSGVVIHEGPETLGPISQYTGRPIYSVRVSKYGDEEWRVLTELDDEPLTAPHLASLLNDLAWARDDAARLNEATER